MERGHVTSSSNRLSRGQVMTFHAFGCHTQRNVKAVHVENHVPKSGKDIISGSDLLIHQTPTMFTGVDFLHSRFFYIMSKCHDLQKKQDPCHRSFFCALSQVPSAARLVRPGCKGMAHCGTPSTCQKRLFEPTVVERGRKKRPNQKWMETNWRPKQCYQDNHKL